MGVDNETSPAKYYVLIFFFLYFNFTQNDACLARELILKVPQKNQCDYKILIT